MQDVYGLTRQLELQLIPNVQMKQQVPSMLTDGQDIEMGVILGFKNFVLLTRNCYLVL